VKHAMRQKFANRVLTCIVSFTLALAMNPVGLQATAYQTPAPPPAQNQPPAPDQPQSAHLTPAQLQELVAPIALYPDALLAQILAASAYPTQIVEAQRFIEQNPNLKGTALGTEVDKQDWDPSVKALTQFPSVLANMDKDLSWTSELGDANYNQAADVMDAVQVLRKKAQKAGNLKSTPQQTVTDQGPSVVIQPADPQVVYVPEYDPELIYGYPIGLWPGFYPWWGVAGPYLSFGVGFGISPFFGFGWGWRGWGFDWGHRGILYGGGRYAFRSHSFYDRNAYFHGNSRGYSGNYRGFASPYNRGDRSLRGYNAPAGRAAPAARPQARSGGAFGGIDRGGDTRGFSSRGQSSMGGFRGGGGFGGARGGGGGGARGGGGRR
jgi:uncharacterized membrane protein YgcG